MRFKFSKEEEKNNWMKTCKRIWLINYVRIRKCIGSLNGQLHWSHTRPSNVDQTPNLNRKVINLLTMGIRAKNYFMRIVKTMQQEEESMQMFTQLCTITGNKIKQLIDTKPSMNVQHRNCSTHNATMGWKFWNLFFESSRNRFHVSMVNVGTLSTIEKYLNQHQAPTESWVNKAWKEGM